MPGSEQSRSVAVSLSLTAFADTREKKLLPRQPLDLKCVTLALGPTVPYCNFLSSSSELLPGNKYSTEHKACNRQNSFS
jgi:hypothetical protein